MKYLISHGEKSTKNKCERGDQKIKGRFEAISEQNKSLENTKNEVQGGANFILKNDTYFK